jgi:hypothetical protein
MLGCAGAAASGGGCGAGAVGAIIGELTSSYAVDSGMTDSQAAALAKTLGAAAGVLVGGGGDNAAAVNVAASTAANAAESNRLLHKTESQKASQLAASSGGKFTKKQIEDAMRNSGNKAYGENVTAGMVNPDTTVEEQGAVFNVGGDSKSVVQTLPNGGKVDPALAAYIIANTGGANSPYAWMDVQTGQSTAAATDPIAEVKWQGDAKWNYMGMNASGVAPGVNTDNRTQAQIDESLNRTTAGIATAPVWVPVVGAAAAYSPLGFGLGVGGDAAGQAYQAYNSTGQLTIRPAQSVFSGVTGAIALPLAARLPAVSMSVQGAAGLAGNAAVGGVTGATNTFLNNVYYDEATRLDAAFCPGQVFSHMPIGRLIADFCSKALGGKLPSLECSRWLL